MTAPLARRAFAESVGTSLPVLAVVGSAVAAERLSPVDTGLQLLENAAATAVALVAIILAVGSVSGAHLNPVITLADRAFGGLSTKDAAPYVVAQCAGGAAGAVIANAIFSLLTQRATVRPTRSCWLGLTRSTGSSQQTWRRRCGFES